MNIWFHVGNLLKNAMPLHHKLHDLLLRCGISLSSVTPCTQVQELFGKLKYNNGGKLIHLGSSGDGGYWIPDDLEGVDYCFSPGVANQSSFEEDLAMRGIKVFLADRSVEKPPVNNPNFLFLKSHVGSFSDESVGLISLNQWYAKVIPASERNEDNLLLQMDIEGCEYEVIHSVSEELLKKFRILIIEFHNLHQLYNCNHFGYMSRAFDKLLQHHQVCCVNQNFSAGYMWIGNEKKARLLEITFHRKNRY